jgi:hypothetical protein
MNDLAVVRRGERVGDLPRDVQRVVERQRTPCDPLREVLALYELHDQRAVMRADAGRERLDALDLRDVRVVQ